MCIYTKCKSCHAVNVINTMYLLLVPFEKKDRAKRYELICTFYAYTGCPMTLVRSVAAVAYFNQLDKEHGSPQGYML